MNAGEIKLDMGKLEALNRSIQDDAGTYVKVGVLGASAVRGKGQTGNQRWKSTAKWSRGLTVQNAAGKVIKIGPGYLTNAQIGAIHEFGSVNHSIPERSILRMPILSRLSDELKKTPLKDWEDYLIKFGLKGLLRAIGQSAVGVIQDAFHTGGFGRWAKLKPATVKRKGSTEILVETTQLRRSITFAVVDGRKGP